MWAFITCAESLPAFVLAVVIVIIAGPQQLSEPKSKKVMTNIELCVDVSGSMAASFGEGTRYDASMKAIDRFLSFREGDAFGLTFFGHTVLHWAPLTNDVSAIRCSPPFMNPKNKNHPRHMGGTAIGKALIACHKRLVGRKEGDRMIVLVSDGQSPDLGGGNDIKIAKKLAADRVVVYGIHISPSNVPDSIVNIAAMTGGEIFAPDDPTALEVVFRRIDEMQETKIEKTSAENMDHFVPYSIAGLSVLGMSVLSLFGLRYTPW